MSKQWIKVGQTNDIPSSGGACTLVDGKQIAIFTDSDRANWYATDNLCPHKQQMVLSRGLVGCENGEPKVACPLHKHTFSLKTGEHMGGDKTMNIQSFPIRIENEEIFIEI